MTETGIPALHRAKDILGGQSAIARAVGVKQPSVHRILHEGKSVPAKWCIPIERATRGKVTRHELRPDLYPIDEQSEAAQ